MLGILALLNDLQIALVVLGCLLGVTHAFQAVTFEESNIRIARQQSIIGVEFLVSAFEIL